MRIRFIVIYYILLKYLVLPSSIHGGTFLAVGGHDSVTIGCDSRFSSQMLGPFMIAEVPRHMFRVGLNTIVGCFGLDSDAISLMDYIRENLSQIYLKHISPRSVARIISDRLYNTQSMCAPIVIGLDDGKPYICCMDSLGAQTETTDFAVVGTSASGLYAICESTYKPNLQGPQLVQLIEKSFESALERDVLSGCQVHIFTITKDGIFEKKIMTSDV